MIVIVATIILGAVFLFSGASKVAAGEQWPAQARALGVPSSIAMAVPWIEIVLGAVLVSQSAAVPAAVAALVVLSAFTTVILVRLAKGEHPPCACFGSWSAKPIGATTVVRNVALMALALAAALAE